MNPYRRGVEALQALNDPELVSAYEAYVSRLEQQLGPDEMELYRSFQQRAQSAASPPPEEQTVAAKVDADPELQPLYERYLTLLGDRQAHANTPDEPVRRGRARVY